MQEFAPKTLTFDDNSIDPSNCFATAFEIVKRGWIIYVIAAILIVIISSIPIVGLILMGPMAVGFQFLALNDLGRGNVDLGDLFVGFKKFFSLMILGWIVNLPTFIASVVDLISTAISLVTTGISILPQPSSDPNFFTSSGGLSTAPPMSGWIIAVMVFSALAIWLATIVWSLLFSFALPIKYEHDVPMFEAIKLSFTAVWFNLGKMAILVIYGIIAAVLGFLALCVGLLFALPVILAAQAIAYRMAFPNGDMESFNTATPQGSMLGLND